MKFRRLYITTVLLFLMLNTSYYWEGLLGIWNILIILFYIICFSVVIISFFYHLFKILKEQGKNQQRLYLLITMAVLLGLCVYKPYGLVNYEQFEGKDVLVASREGSANCTVTLKLKESGKFSLRDVCFGVDKYIGTYTVNNDTINLYPNPSKSNIKNYRYAVIKIKPGYGANSIGELNIYTTKKDTVPIQVLWISKNELLKK